MVVKEKGDTFLSVLLEASILNMNECVSFTREDRRVMEWDTEGIILEIIFSFFLHHLCLAYRLHPFLLGSHPSAKTIAIPRPDDYRVKLSAWIFFKNTPNTQSFRQWEMQFFVSQRLEMALNLRADTCSLAPSGSDLK